MGTEGSRIGSGFRKGTFPLNSFKIYFIGSLGVFLASVSCVVTVQFDVVDNKNRFLFFDFDVLFRMGLRVF